MLETLNRYCSNCLATERFLVLGATLVCPHCSKRLEMSGGDPSRSGGNAPSPAAPQSAPTRNGASVLRHPGRDPHRQAG